MSSTPAWSFPSVLACGCILRSHARPLGATALGVVVFSVAVYLAATVNDIVIQLTMATLALLALILGAAFWRYFSIDRFRRVRVRALRDSVRFVAPSWMQFLRVAAGIAGVAPALVWWWLVSAGLAAQFFRSGALLALGVLGAVVLVLELTRLPHPSGLTLSSRGVRGVRGARRVDLSWQELASIEVVYDPRGAKLLFCRETPAQGILIDSRALASDPRLVAMVVEHYRAHPEHRAELDGAEAAIERIREGRF